jgi:microcompartment protein CcmL/EutN
VIAAIGEASFPDKPDAIGIIEFYSVVGSILAADTAVEAANVDIVTLRLGTGIAGKSFLVVTGDQSACRQAIAAAVQGQKDSGMLMNSIVIPRPRKEVFDSLL